jgi:hypothetical protein
LTSRKLEGSLKYKDKLRRYRLTEEDSDSFLASLHLDAKRRVATTLSRTRQGFAVDLATPWLGKSTVDKDARRMEISNDLLARTAGTGLAALDSAELSQAEKVGSLSIMVPFADRKEDLLRYYSYVPGVQWNAQDILSAFERIVTKLPRGLKPISVEDAFNEMPKGTNLGSPWFSRSAEFYPELIERANLLEKSGYDIRAFNDPCLLYWRGQSQGPYKLPKQRPVWGYPHYWTIAELRLQESMLPYLSRMPEFCALVSKEAVATEVTGILKMRNLKFSVDFSGFDTTLDRTLISFVWEMVRRSFHRSARKLIDAVENRFFHIPLLHPDGIWSGWHTVPSGSAWTNQVDSLAQWLLAEIIAAKLNTRLVKILVQGDDGVWVFRDKLGLKDIQRIVDQFGMFISSDKGGISTDTVLYLQDVHMSEYLHEDMNVGVRPIQRALPGLLGFETPRDKEWRPVDTTFRSIQQLENCRYHPNIEVAVRLLMENDRLLRENNIRALVYMAGGLSELEARQKSKGFPYGKYPLSGVYDFTVVRIAERLRSEFSRSSRVA